MQINLDYDEAAYQVRSCREGEIIIRAPVAAGADGAPAVMEDIRITSSAVITRSRLYSDWPPRALAELKREHFAELLKLRPEVVLLGTGARMRFPDRDCTADLIAQGIGVEVMDTPAACRTYNFLIADGRKVAAALIVEA